MGPTGTHDTLYSRQTALPTELPRQLSWLGPNLTSHNTPDEQAYYQLKYNVWSAIPLLSLPIPSVGTLSAHCQEYTCTQGDVWCPGAYNVSNHDEVEVHVLQQYILYMYI